MKITTSAFKNKDMPLILNNKEIYLDFQLKGRCNRGSNYRNASLHCFLEKPDFKKLINWSKEILKKHNEKVNEDNPPKTIDDAKHLKEKIEIKPTKEEKTVVPSKMES